jgi:hypothetical protein
MATSQPARGTDRLGTNPVVEPALRFDRWNLRKNDPKRRLRALFQIYVGPEGQRPPDGHFRRTAGPERGRTASGDMKGCLRDPAINQDRHA